MSAPDRRAMLDRADKSLSVRRQCALVGVARSGVYRARKPANDNDGALMRRIDELFTAWPFLGSRRMTAMLRAEGVNVNRKRVQRLMRLMGIAALAAEGRKRATRARPPDLSLSPARSGDQAGGPHLGGRHHVHSDRAGLSLSGGDHRLGVARGSGVAAVGRDGRLVLSCGARGGSSEVRQARDFQHRPGSQFTSAAFTGALAEAGITISMNSREHSMDDVFIERLSQYLEYKDVYLKGCADGGEAAHGIAAWIAFYNDGTRARRSPTAHRWRIRAQGNHQRRGCRHDGRRIRVAHIPTQTKQHSLSLRDKKRSPKQSSLGLTVGVERSRCAGPFHATGA